MAFNPTIPAYSTQGKSFSRTAAFPLEGYEIWTDYEALVAYAANTDPAKDPSYIGQKVAYIDTANQRVIHYGIEIDGTLKELGADKMGVEDLTAADEGKVPQAFKVIDTPASGVPDTEDYQPEVSHIEIRWVEINGQNTVTTMASADESVTITDNGSEGNHAYDLKVNFPEIPEQTDYTISMAETVDGLDSNIAKKYTFTQCGKEIGSINLAKDLVVKAGSVEEVTQADQPYAGAAVGDKYIKLVIANQDEPIYVPAKDLVDIYTVADTNTVDMTITGSEIKADIKISSEEGNSLVAKEDGLYVNAPVLPTTEDSKVESQVVVAVSQKDGAITVLREQLSYNDLKDIPEIPSVAVGEATAVSPAPAEATANVIASLIANGHTITPSTIEVATKAGLEAITSTGSRLITDEEINKLSQLTLEEGGGVAISGTINATNVQGLGSEVVEIVTGTGSYVSTPAVGTEGSDGYVPATIISKLGIEKNAQVNKIETVALPDAVLAIDSKQVNIPAFTEGKYGVIKGAELVEGAAVANKVYAADGVGEVKALSTDILVNGEDEFIIFGGNASGLTE